MELGALLVAPTFPQPRLEVQAHPRDPLSVGEHVGLRSGGSDGHAVLTAVHPSAAGDSGDVKLFAEHQLVIRLVDTDRNDVQGSDAGLDAAGFMQ